MFPLVINTPTINNSFDMSENNYVHDDVLQTSTIIHNNLPQCNNTTYISQQQNDYTQWSRVTAPPLPSHQNGFLTRVLQHPENMEERLYERATKCQPLMKIINPNLLSESSITKIKAYFAEKRKNLLQLEVTFDIKLAEYNKFYYYSYPEGTPHHHAWTVEKVNIQNAVLYLNSKREAIRVKEEQFIAAVDEFNQIKYTKCSDTNQHQILLTPPPTPAVLNQEDMVDCGVVNQRMVKQGIMDQGVFEQGVVNQDVVDRNNINQSVMNVLEIDKHINTFFEKEFDRIKKPLGNVMDMSMTDHMFLEQDTTSRQVSYITKNCQSPLVEISPIAEISPTGSCTTMNINGRTFNESIEKDISQNQKSTLRQSSENITDDDSLVDVFLSKYLGLFEGT